MKKPGWKTSVAARGPVAVRHRIGAVSYLNTLPLLEGLEDLPEVDLTRTVPADLREMLVAGQVETAHLPAIDLQRYEGRAMVVPAGCVSCAGRC